MFEAYTAINCSYCGQVILGCKEHACYNINNYKKENMKDKIIRSYMQARKDMFASWCEYVEEWKRSLETEELEGPLIDSYKTTPIFIDGRLTAEQLTIFCVTPDKIEDYKEHLFDDSEVEAAVLVPA